MKRGRERVDQLCVFVEKERRGDTATKWQHYTAMAEGDVTAVDFL